MSRFHQTRETVLQSVDALRDHVARTGSLANCTVQDMDLAFVEMDWDRIEILNTNFFGCHLLPELETMLRAQGAFIFPKVPHLPYNPYRKSLYRPEELLEGYHPQRDESVDLKIYEHFTRSRYNPPIDEALLQRIHDHAIDHSLRELLDFDAVGMTRHKCVGIMGGHSTLRTDPNYRKVVLTAKLLAEAGYYIASGGGPGIMEAANLGAFLAGQTEDLVEDALMRLGRAPHYTDRTYMQRAQEVVKMVPDGKESLAIPTWFYGHEPSNLFATYVAKYFSNSIREDTLLAVSLHGVVFAPGSAGTTQEIFMDAAQNHYGTFNYYSPMVFLSEKRYAIETLIFPLVRQLSYGRKYHDMITMTDSPNRVLSFLQEHPPVPVDK